jgi:hypothetical protein
VTGDNVQESGSENQLRFIRPSRSKITRKELRHLPYVKHRAENDLFCTVADEPPDPT